MKINELGSFFLGDEGLKKIKLLSAKLYDQIKTDTERSLGISLPRYFPWMALAEKREVLRPLMQLNEILEIETRPDVLEALHQAISSPQDYLAAFNLDVPFLDRRIMNAYQEEKEAYQKKMLEAKELLCSSHPLLNERYNTLIYTIIPLVPTKAIYNPKAINGTHRSGVSSIVMRGAIFHLVPCFPDIEHWLIDLAVDLAHEVGHHALDVYLAADRLIESGLDTMVYSPIRKVNRPAILSFHADAALAYIIECIEIFLKNETFSPSQKEYLLSERNKFRKDLEIGIESLNGVKLTPVGTHILNEFKSMLDWSYQHGAKP